MITLRVNASIIESVLGAAVRCKDLTQTERWNIAHLSNVAASAVLDELGTDDIEGVPIP